MKQLYRIIETDVDGCGSDAASGLYTDPQDRDPKEVTDAIMRESEAFLDRKRALRNETDDNAADRDEEDDDGTYDSDELFEAVVEAIGLAPVEDVLLTEVEV